MNPRRRKDAASFSEVRDPAESSIPKEEVLANRMRRLGVRQEWSDHEVHVEGQRLRKRARTKRKSTASMDGWGNGHLALMPIAIFEDLGRFASEMLNRGLELSMAWTHVRVVLIPDFCPSGMRGGRHRMQRSLVGNAQGQNLSQ